MRKENSASVVVRRLYIIYLQKYIFDNNQKSVSQEQELNII